MKPPAYRRGWPHGQSGGLYAPHNYHLGGVQLANNTAKKTNPRVRLALNKTISSLRSFGIEQPIAQISEDGRSAYIAIDLEDLGRAIEKKLQKRLTKELPRGVALVVTVEDGMLGVMVKEVRPNTKG